MKFGIAVAALLVLASCGQKSPDGSGSAVSGNLVKPLAGDQVDGPAPGKWRLTTIMDGSPGASFEHCYERRITFAEAQEMEQQAGVKCSERKFARVGNTIVGHSVCQMGDMKITTDTRVTGDLNKAYTMDVTSSIDPAPIPSAAHSVMQIKGERIGDCEG